MNKNDLPSNGFTWVKLLFLILSVFFLFISVVWICADPSHFLLPTTMISCVLFAFWQYFALKKDGHRFQKMLPSIVWVLLVLLDGCLFLGMLGSESTGVIGNLEELVSGMIAIPLGSALLGIGIGFLSYQIQKKKQS